VQSVIWEINPFDQWGVEKGKKLASSLLPEFQSQVSGDLDSSTRGLIQRVQRQQAQYES
jgi:glucose-6-phosphate isomerase